MFFDYVGNIEKLSNGHEKLKTSDFNHNVQSNKIEEDVNRMNSQVIRAV